MLSFRRAVAPITKRFVNQPHVRMMSNSSTGGFYRSFGNTLSFYNANKGVLNFAAGALITLAGVGILTSFNVPVMPQLEPAADSVLRAFEKDRDLEPFNKSNMIDRKELVDNLLPILQPSESNSYVVIVGEKGTGKTTAVRQALAALERPRGAVYINCPVTADEFSVYLAKLIGFHEQLDISGGVKRKIESTTKEEKNVDPKDEPLATFRKLQQPLIDAAATFKAKYGRPMVLVIDSTDLLAKQCPAFLGILQDFAKNCADDGHLRIVFISSDGSALPLMMARSSWSRAENPPFEIGEIPDDQAVEYLTKNGVREDEAKVAVANLTGGLFSSLNGFATASLKGMTYEQLAEQRDSALDSKLSDLETSVNNALFRHLVKHSSIKTNEARRVFGMKKDQLEVLLKNNILAVHPNDTYTFHDRHTATWFSREVKKAAWWPGW